MNVRQQLGDEVGNFDKYACGGVKSWLQERGRVSFLGACFDERKVSREQPARGQNYWLSEDCKTLEQKSEKKPGWTYFHGWFLKEMFGRHAACGRGAN